MLFRTNILFVVALTCACRATPPSAPPAARPPPEAPRAAVVPRGDAAYFPLVVGAVYEYDAAFGEHRTHERRLVRAAETPVGRMFYFIDADDEREENPSIGSNGFGLGVYRVTDAGVETADVYFRDDAAKVLATGVQFALRFPIQPGATTTFLGGKKLETTVGGEETITVPAGTFTCLRLDQREVWPEAVHEGAVWLARGIGTVKRVYVTGRTETLTAFKLP